MENSYMRESIYQAPAPQAAPAPQPTLTPEQQRNKALRRVSNVQGGTLLIYKAILNIAVVIVVMVAMMSTAFGQAFDMAMNGSVSEEELLNQLTESMTQVMLDSMGWGYLLAIAIGTLILLLWKKPAYIRQTLLQKGKPMTFASFAAVLCLFMAGQFVYQMLGLAAEGVCNLFGFSILEQMESSAVDTTSLGMFLYVCVLGPVTEEILFRGLLLRSIEPYGKKLAILTSAIMFGLYHGNPLQSSYAMVVGIVLGYVAAEYNILWATLLHIINNLLIADTLPRLLDVLLPGMGDAVIGILMLAFFVAAAVVVYCNRRRILADMGKERLEEWQYRGFFCSPTVLIVSISCLLDMVLFVMMILFAYA